jgi:hypothetical protein
VFSLGGLGVIDAEERASSIRRRQSDDVRAYLPDWPCGTLDYIRSRPEILLSEADIVDALHIVVALRLWLNFLERQHLRRGRREARHVKGLTQIAMGAVLGMTGEGVSMRIKALKAAQLGLSTTKISPRYARVSVSDAVSAAQNVIESRADHTEIPHPAPEDLFGVAAFVLDVAHHDDAVVPLELIPDDVKDCLRIVACLRRHLDALEEHYLSRGRTLGVPNLVLGAPFGRKSYRATWLAHRRLTNAAQPGGRHIVTSDDTKRSGRDHASHAKSPSAPEWAAALLRSAAVTLVELQEQKQLVADEELDSDVCWLRDAGVHLPGTAIGERERGLLWLVCDSISDSKLVDQIDGLRKLATDVNDLLRQLR